MKRPLISAIALLTCSACANFTPPATQRTVSRNGVHWITYDSSRRGTLLAVQDGAVVRSCAEPAPDTAYSFVNSVKGSAKKPEGPDASVDLAFNATALALAGRDNLVLLARESLFRLCEARANNDISEADYGAGFVAVLNQITAIATGNKSKDEALRVMGASNFQALREKTRLQVLGAQDDEK
jgi:hypothetical protein